MNKRAIFMLISFVFCFFMSPIIYSESVYAAEIEYMYDAVEFAEIEKLLDFDAIDENIYITADSVTSMTEASSLSPYKLFSISVSDLSELSENPDKINEIVSGEYKWLVSDEHGWVEKIGKINDEWHILGYSTLETETEQAALTQSRFVKNILNTNETVAESVNSTDASTETYICFEVAQFHTSFIGCFSDNESYVIPFCNRPDLTELENGKKYSIKEVCEVLTEKFISGDANVNSGSVNAGSYVQKLDAESVEADNNIYDIALKISVFPVICIIIILLFRKRKNMVIGNN